jgi:hypothetical protein
MEGADDHGSSDVAVWDAQFVRTALLVCIMLLNVSILAAE